MRFRPNPPPSRFQLNTLLAGQTVFDRPATLLSVQLVGVGAGALGELPAGAVVTPLLGDSMQVAAALAPLDGVALSVRCAVACGSACLSAQLGGAAPALAVGEAYSEALAQELSCFLDALRLQLAQQPDARLITARLSALPPTLLNGPQAGAAAAALRATLAAALTQLQASRGDAAALHIVLLDSAPAAPLPSRRALLQAPSQLGRDVNAWYAKVAAFGVGILLLVAILGTIVALCTMPTGQDTLLYAKHKGE